MLTEIQITSYLYFRDPGIHDDILICSATKYISPQDGLCAMLEQHKSRPASLSGEQVLSLVPLWIIAANA